MPFKAFAFLTVLWFAIAVAALSLGIMADLHQAAAPAFPLLPVLVTQTLLNTLGVVLVKSIGVAQIDGYRWYMPFEGGQSFVIITAVAMTISVNCTIGVAAYFGSTYYMDRVLYGLLSIFSLGSFVAQCMMLLGLSMFEKNSPNQWHWLKRLAAPPNRETAIVSTLIAFIVIVMMLAEMRNTVRIAMSFIALLLHIGCGLVIHVIIGWKLTPNYRLFMPIPAGKVSLALAQGVIWILWTAVLQAFFALTIFPPNEVPPYTYIFTGLTSALSMVGMVVFVRTFTAESLPPSTSFLVNYGPQILTLGTALLAMDIVVAGIIAGRPEWLPTMLYDSLMAQSLAQPGGGAFVPSATEGVSPQTGMPTGCGLTASASLAAVDVVMDAYFVEGGVNAAANAAPSPSSVEDTSDAKSPPNPVPSFVKFSPGALAAIDATQQICAAFLVGITPFTHLLGGLIHGASYSTFQPFKGSISYVALQGIGWTLYSFALLFLILSFAIDREDEVHRMWLAAFAHTILAAQMLIMASVRAFEDEEEAERAARKEARRERRRRREASLAAAVDSGEGADLLQKTNRTDSTVGSMGATTASAQSVATTASENGLTLSAGSNAASRVTSSDESSDDGSSSSSSCSSDADHDDEGANPIDATMAREERAERRLKRRGAVDPQNVRRKTTRQQQRKPITAPTVSTTFHHFLNGEMIVAMLLGAFGFLMRFICDTLLVNGAVLGVGAGDASFSSWFPSPSSTASMASSSSSSPSAFWGPSNPSERAAAVPRAPISPHITALVPPLLFVSTALLAVATPAAQLAHRRALRDAGFYWGSSQRTVGGRTGGAVGGAMGMLLGGGGPVGGGASGMLGGGSVGGSSTIVQGPGEATALQAVGWTVYAVTLIVMITSCFEPLGGADQLGADQQFFPYSLEAIAALVPFGFVSMSMFVLLRLAEGQQVARREAILDLKMILKATIRDPMARNEVGNRIDRLLRITLGAIDEEEDDHHHHNHHSDDGEEEATYADGSLRRRRRCKGSTKRGTGKSSSGSGRRRRGGASFVSEDGYDSDGNPVYVPLRFGGEVLFESMFDNEEAERAAAQRQRQQQQNTNTNANRRSNSRHNSSRASTTDGNGDGDDEVSKVDTLNGTATAGRHHHHKHVSSISSLHGIDGGAQQSPNQAFTETFASLATTVNTATGSSHQHGKKTVASPTSRSEGGGGGAVAATSLHQETHQQAAAETTTTNASDNNTAADANNHSRKQSSSAPMSNDRSSALKAAVEAKRRNNSNNNKKKDNTSNTTSRNNANKDAMATSARQEKKAVFKGPISLSAAPSPVSLGLNPLPTAGSGGAKGAAVDASSSSLMADGGSTSNVLGNPSSPTAPLDGTVSSHHHHYHNHCGQSFAGSVRKAILEASGRGSPPPSTGGNGASSSMRNTPSKNYPPHHRPIAEEDDDDDEYCDPSEASQSTFANTKDYNTYLDTTLNTTLGGTARTLLATTTTSNGSDPLSNASMLANALTQHRGAAKHDHHDHHGAVGGGDNGGRDLSALPPSLEDTVTSLRSGDVGLHHDADYHKQREQQHRRHHRPSAKKDVVVVVGGGRRRESRRRSLLVSSSTAGGATTSSNRSNSTMGPTSSSYANQQRRGDETSSAKPISHNTSAALIVAQMAGFTLLAFIVALVHKGRSGGGLAHAATPPPPSNASFFVRFTSQPRNEILATLFALGGTILMTVSVLMMQCIYGPFIHGQAFRFAMPFRGGYTFVGLQGVGWGLFSAAWAIFILYAMEMTHGVAPLAVGCLLCIAAEVFVFLSIPHFRTRSRPPTFVEENSEAVITALTFVIAFGLMRTVETLAGHHASPISILISTVALCIALPLAAVALRKSSRSYDKHRRIFNDLEDDDEGVDEEESNHNGHARHGGVHASEEGDSINGGAFADIILDDSTRRAGTMLQNSTNSGKSVDSHSGMVSPSAALFGITGDVGLAANSNATATTVTPTTTLLATAASSAMAEAGAASPTSEEALAALAASVMSGLMATARASSAGGEGARPSFASPLFSPQFTDDTTSSANGSQCACGGGGNLAASGTVETPLAVTGEGEAVVVSAPTPTDGKPPAASPTTEEGEEKAAPSSPTPIVVVPLTQSTLKESDRLNKTNAKDGKMAHFRRSTTDHLSVVPSSMASDFGPNAPSKMSRLETNSTIAYDDAEQKASAVGSPAIGGLWRGLGNDGQQRSATDNTEAAAAVAGGNGAVASTSLTHRHHQHHQPKYMPPIAHIKRTPSLLLEAVANDDGYDRDMFASLRRTIAGKGGSAARLEGLGDIGARSLLAKMRQKHNVKPPLVALEYVAFAVVAAFPVLILFLSYYAFNDYAVGVTSTLSLEQTALGLLTAITLLVIWRRTEYYTKAIDCIRTYAVFMIPVIVVGTGFALPVITPSFGTFALAVTIILLTFFPGKWRMFVGNFHMLLLAFVVYTYGKSMFYYASSRFIFTQRAAVVAVGNSTAASAASSTATTTDAASSPDQSVFLFLSSHYPLDIFMMDLVDGLMSLASLLIDMLPIYACAWYGQFLRGRPDTDGSHFRPSGLRLCYAELFSYAERFFDVRVLADDLHATRKAQKVHYHYHHHHHKNTATNETTTTTTTTTSGGAVIGFHPHGVFPMTLLWVHFTRRWERMFAGCPRIVSHGASIIFQTPILRDVVMTVGARVVTKAAIEQVIKDGMTPVIVPGGQAEMIHSRVGDKELHIVTYHTGFIRLAMLHKRAVIPLLSFGEHDILGNINAPTMQAFFLKRVGFGFPVLPIGQWGLPFPLQAKLRIALGKPITPAEGEDDGTNPAHVAKVAAAYFEELRYIFYKYREDAGYPNMELYFHNDKKDPLKAEVMTPTPPPSPLTPPPEDDEAYEEDEEEYKGGAAGDDVTTTEEGGDASTSRCAPSPASCGAVQGGGGAEEGSPVSAATTSTSASGGHGGSSSASPAASSSPGSGVQTTAAANATAFSAEATEVAALGGAAELGAASS